jgi:hypothetical protein
MRRCWVLALLLAATVVVGVPLTTTRVIHTRYGKLQGFVRKVSTGSFASQMLKPVEVSTFLTSFFWF